MLALIGGSGLYQLDGLTVTARHEVTTPFGAPSSIITEGHYLGQQVLFLARHGEGHQFLPHEVNYRANIFALKSLGARRVLGFSAAGSLRKEIRPGELALTAQYFDHTRGKRNYSFFGGGVSAHVSTAYPTCPAFGADITDAATRSALALLFKQFVLATPKTRSLTITIGDIKITSPPVQHTHWQAARGQPDPRRFSSGQQQRHRVHNAKQRRSANRAAERAGQPPPYPKPSMAKEEQAAHPGMPAPAAPPPAQPAAPPPAQPAPVRGAPPPPQQLEAGSGSGQGEPASGRDVETAFPWEFANGWHGVGKLLRGGAKLKRIQAKLIVAKL